MSRQQTPRAPRLAVNVADTSGDMLFGTYANPRGSIDTCGFDEHTERQIVPMLAGVDLSRPR
jgi:hypothetical protein